MSDAFICNGISSCVQGFSPITYLQEQVWSTKQLGSGVLLQEWKRFAMSSSEALHYMNISCTTAATHVGYILGSHPKYQSRMWVCVARTNLLCNAESGGVMGRGWDHQHIARAMISTTQVLWKRWRDHQSTLEQAGQNTLGYLLRFFTHLHDRPLSLSLLNMMILICLSQYVDVIECSEF